MFQLYTQNFYDYTETLISAFGDHSHEHQLLEERGAVWMLRYEAKVHHAHDKNEALIAQLEEYKTKSSEAMKLCANATSTAKELRMHILPIVRFADSLGHLVESYVIGANATKRLDVPCLGRSRALVTERPMQNESMSRELGQDGDGASIALR